MIRKIGCQLGVLVAVVAGWIYWTPQSHELAPDQIALRWEGLNNGSLRWCFDADDAEGRPLETVFYTMECTPDPAENAVDVVVRLYDTPAEGRRKLNKTGERDSRSAAFDLECPCPAVSADLQPGLSYRICFGGRNLGSWKTDAENALADILAE